MWFVQRVIPWLVLALVASPAHAADTVWEALQTAGSIVVLRHSFAPGGFDPPDARLDDCSTQRNLDDSGRRQARLIGEVSDFPDESRLASYFAFGRVESWDPLQGALDDTQLRRQRVDEIKKVMSEQRDGPLLVLVTHGSVVTDLTGLNVRMGEFVVLGRGADGAYSVAGRLYVE